MSFKKPPLLNLTCSRGGKKIMKEKISCEVTALCSADGVLVVVVVFFIWLDFK